jgi:hypothetical protein
MALYALVVFEEARAALLAAQAARQARVLQLPAGDGWLGLYPLLLEGKTSSEPGRRQLVLEELKASPAARPAPHLLDLLMFECALALEAGPARAGHVLAAVELGEELLVRTGLLAAPTSAPASAPPPAARDTFLHALPSLEVLRAVCCFQLGDLQAGLAWFARAMSRLAEHGPLAFPRFWCCFYVDTMRQVLAVVQCLPPALVCDALVPLLAAQRCTYPCAALICDMILAAQCPPSSSSSNPPLPLLPIPSVPSAWALSSADPNARCRPVPCT